MRTTRINTGMVALGALVCGCGLLVSEKAAREELEGTGFRDITLTRDGGKFQFEATREGKKCSGSVVISGGTKFVSSSCEAPPPPACGPEAAAVCFHDALDKQKAGDDAGAAALFDKGCSFGNADSCNNLGFSYDNARGVAKDPERALQLFAKACGGGAAMGCANQARKLRASRKLEEARKVVEKGCTTDYAEGCFLAGAMLLDGEGGPADAARGAALFDKGCSSKEPSQNACGLLGLLLLQGRGVAADATRGETLLAKACEGGSPRSCMRLGMALRDGEGLAKDPARALTLLERGCSGGEADSCSEVGLSHEKATGTARDLAKALTFYEKACVGGSDVGCLNQGLALQFGRGAPRDVRKAAELFDKACGLGQEKACKQRKTLP